MLKDRILEIRKRLGLKQGEFAKVIGVSQATICSYEKGDALPSIEMLKKIADIGNVALDYLLERETPAQIEIEKIQNGIQSTINNLTTLLHAIDSIYIPQLNKHEEKIIELIRQLEPDKQEDIIKYCRYLIQTQ
ncbi:MAG: helix-turn-helix transcriptional regulator [bacterium]